MIEASLAATSNPRFRSSFKSVVLEGLTVEYFTRIQIRRKSVKERPMKAQPLTRHYAKCTAVSMSVCLINRYLSPGSSIVRASHRRSESGGFDSCLRFSNFFSEFATKIE